MQLVCPTLPRILDNVADDFVDSDLQRDEGLVRNAVLHTELFKRVSDDGYVGYIVGDGDHNCIDARRQHDASQAHRSDANAASMRWPAVLGKKAHAIARRAKRSPRSTSHGRSWASGW